MKRCNDSSDKRYVLITSAYNEEKYMAKTIESVLKQTLLPETWIIISDGSVDKTDSIIKEYGEKHSFIKYMRRSVKDKKGHDFASKVHALNTVLGQLDFDKYNFLGILDADILLPSNYYEILMNRMEENQKYGVLGGMIYETRKGKQVKYDISLNTVCGAIQLFRMDCFKMLGDFLPMRFGGEDSMMCVSANYHGWISRSFTDIRAMEQKIVGMACGSPWNTRKARGKGFYDMGYHPLFLIAKCLYRIKEPPFFIGSLAEIGGYVGLALRRSPRASSEELISFLRAEQLERLRKMDTKRK
jgi:poly-beta-1,6-N-acetyl-D-glucosamine synthase